MHGPYDVTPCVPAGGADLRVAGVDLGPVPMELQECAAVAIVVHGNPAPFAVSAHATAGAPGVLNGAGALEIGHAGGLVCSEPRALQSCAAQIFASCL